MVNDVATSSRFKYLSPLFIMESYVICFSQAPPNDVEIISVKSMVSPNEAELKYRYKALRYSMRSAVDSRSSSDGRASARAACRWFDSTLRYSAVTTALQIRYCNECWVNLITLASPIILFFCWLTLNTKKNVA